MDESADQILEYDDGDHGSENAEISAENAASALAVGTDFCVEEPAEDGREGTQTAQNFCRNLSNQL